MTRLTKVLAAFAALALSACTAPIFTDASFSGGADVQLQGGTPVVVLGLEFQIDFVDDSASEDGVAPNMDLEGNSAKPILDLIGFTEGTDKGDGYNETLSYGAFTHGDVVLTGMTLAEIDTLQTAMLQHPANTWNSSAIGRYQIVRTTLRTLRQELGLDDDLMFDAELQDRLAIELLRGRGYDEWKEGRMSDEQFALNLSKEWASLPNPQTGAGFYSGQNAAVSYAQVKAVFNEAR